MATAEDQDAVKAQRDAMGGCFDMSGQLPAGPNATISSGDWSGIAELPSSLLWFLLCCLWPSRTPKSSLCCDNSLMAT